MKLEHYLLAALTAAGIFLGVECGLFFRAARSAILVVQSDEHTEAIKLDATLTDIDRDTVIASGTLTSIEKGSRRWGKQQDQITAEAIAAETQLSSDLHDLDTLESSLNSMIVQQAGWLHGSEESVSQSMRNFQPTLESLQQTAANSAQASETLSNGLTATMPQIELTAEHTAGTTANVEATTKDVRDFAHRELAPVKGTWNILKEFLFQIAGPASSVATSLK